MNKQIGPAAAFARRVEKERRLKGWNASDLARRAGVGPTTVSRMFNAVGLPLPTTVVAIADAVGLGREEAFELAGYDAMPEVAPKQTAEQEFLTAMAGALQRRLPDVDVAVLSRVAGAMSDIFSGLAKELVEASEDD